MRVSRHWTGRLGTLALVIPFCLPALAGASEPSSVTARNDPQGWSPNGLRFDRVLELAQADAVQIDIPAQPLSDALRALGRQTGLQFFASSELTAGITAPAVSGRMSADEALSRLLAGTGLKHRYSGAKAVTLERNVAQENNGGPMRLGPVTVTARRTKELLQDVPQSVAIIDGEEIERSAIETLEDYFERAPNVAFSENATRTRNIPAIRGISDFGLAGTSAVIGFYVDESSINPLGNGIGIDTNLIDIERVEVIYGPQGTTFGRNALGGVVNIVTKKPTEDFEGVVEGDVNSFPGGGGKLTLNGGILPDGLLSARLNAYGEVSDGFIELSQSGSDDPDSIGERSFGTRLALRSEPTSRLLVDLTGSYARYETDGLNIITRDDFEDDRFVLDTDFIGETSLDRYRAAGKIELDLDAFTLISNTSYFDAERMEEIDSDLSPLDITTFTDLIVDLEEVGQEVRLETTSFDLPLLGTTEAIFGANASFASVESSGLFNLGTASPGGPATSSFSGETELFSLGLFTDVRFRPVQPLEVNVGLRYSRDEVEVTTEQSGPILPPQPPTTLSGNFSSIDPKISLSYRWTDDFLTYATVSTGFRGGSFNSPLSGAPGQPIDEEKAISYEAGFKSSWLDDRLRINAAGFYTMYEDIQVAAPGLIGNQFIINGAEARSTGTELTIEARPIDGLTLGASYGLLFAEFTDFKNSPFGDLTGLRLPRAPRHTVSLVSEYAWPVFGGFGDAFLRSEYGYRSEFRTVLDPAQEPVGNYDLLALRAGIRAEGFDVEAYVENALDERYATNGAIVGTGSVAPGAPIHGGVRARMRF